MVVKYLKLILKFLGFSIILLGGWIGTIVLMTDRHFLFGIIVLLSTILSGVFFTILTENKKCPTCSTKCKPTGIGGSEYKQWHCKTCKNTF